MRRASCSYVGKRFPSDEGSTCRSTCGLLRRGGIGIPISFPEIRPQTLLPPLNEASLSSQPKRKKSRRREKEMQMARESCKYGRENRLPSLFGELSERDDPLWSEIRTLLIVMIKIQLKLDRSVIAFTFTLSAEL